MKNDGQLVGSDNIKKVEQVSHWYQSMRFLRKGANSAAWLRIVEPAKKWGPHWLMMSVQWPDCWGWL